jgi:hypothetical protein
MTIFGWVLILGGGGWAFLGAINVWSAFSKAIYANSEAMRQAASQETAISNILQWPSVHLPGPRRRRHRRSDREKSRAPNAGARDH